MGCVHPALTKEEQKAIEHSTRWDRQLLDENKQDQKQVKLLLLGTGESGKSTILKQMQILHENGFAYNEVSRFQSVVRRNVVECMQALIEGADKLFKIEFENEGSKESKEFMKTLDPHVANFWTNDIVTHIHQLWPNEPAISKTFASRNKIPQIYDSAAYLFENIDRIAKQDYSPTPQDILRARLRTCGIVEKSFDIHGVAFTFLDVGGQRSERRKWIHCFDHVTSIIFVAAISEFDQVLYEEEDENRFDEALNVFEEICNHECLLDTAMILFLNKIDIFQEKIKHTDFKKSFKDFTGDPKSFKDTSSYLEKKVS